MMVNRKIIRVLEDLLNGETVETDEFETAIQMSIMALTKQIPTDVIRYKSMPEDVLLCPTCKSTFTTRNGVLMNNCNNCGQRLKEVK